MEFTLLLDDVNLDCLRFGITAWTCSSSRVDSISLSFSSTDSNSLFVERIFSLFVVETLRRMVAGSSMDNLFKSDWFVRAVEECDNVSSSADDMVSTWVHTKIHM